MLNDQQGSKQGDRVLASILEQCQKDSERPGQLPVQCNLFVDSGTERTLSYSVLSSRIKNNKFKV